VSAVVASIGCSDPWNAAGVGLDLRALLACGVRPVTVIAGVTAQDAAGVHAMQAVEPELLRAQFAALARAGIAAYRIGALLDVATVRIVAEHVRDARAPAVYDPVFAPSGGGSFVDDDVVTAIARELVPHVALVTPNLSEAARLTGGAVPDSVATMERAAAVLFAQGAAAALVKGGHLAAEATDVLVDGLGTVRYDASRIAGLMRGSGCVLACGIAAGLAKGAPLRDAIAQGRVFVRDRLANAVEFGGMHVAF
jgi:hydroxymethylpyrimidine kinase/phosphomethylpyrimidine kinase